MSLDSAFKSSASASPQPQPGVWIQYKQVRARTLQTATQEEQHSGQSKLNILHEFHLDLHALFLDLPGVVMNNVRIIWGTGQVRATYGVYGREFCEIVKFMVKRASTKFIEVMSKRSISRIHYVEDGTQHITANLPDSLPSLTSSYVLPQPPDGSSIRRSISTQSSGQDTAASSRKRRRLSIDDSSPTQVEAAPSRRAEIQPERLAQVSSIDPRFQPPLRLPATHLTREDTHGGSALPQRTLNGTGSSSSFVHPLPPRPIQSSNLVQLSIPQHSGVATKPTDPRLKLAAWRLARPTPAPILTAGACVRLRDPADSSILISRPIVRILVLRDTHSSPARRASAAREAYVTDGSAYGWIALSSSLPVGQADQEDLQVGTTVMLAEMSRLSYSASCAVLVHKLEIVARPVNASSGLGASLSASESHGAPSVTSSDDPAPAGGALQQERAARLLAESKLQDERRRRLFVESLLADVCRDLDNRDRLVPAAMDALTKLAELADAAMLVD